MYCDKVIIDDVEGAKKATNHLIQNGRKSILLITTEDYVSVGNLRTTGYIQALKENNIELDTDLIIKVEDKKVQRKNFIILKRELTKYLN